VLELAVLNDESGVSWQLHKESTAMA
jgi:hypothetical protein